MKRYEMNIIQGGSYQHDGDISIVPSEHTHGEWVKHSDAESLESQNKRLKRINKEMWEMFYGQGLEVANWHQNGDLISIDRFFEDNDWDAESDPPKDD